MDRENHKFAEKFANTIDRAYECGTDLNISDEDFRVLISNALNAWLGTDKSDML